MVEKLNYYNPENVDEINLYNLKKIGTDIVDIKKKQLEKESDLKENLFVKKGNQVCIITFKLT